MSLRERTIAVVGASGAVGREALAILESRAVSRERILALASARSAGTSIPYASGSVQVREVAAESFQRVDVAIFCATADVSRTFAGAAVEHGAIVVDNSSAFRMRENVPLVVPGVNEDSIGSARLIANPNCSTIIMLLALTPLRRAFGVREVMVSTYQAVSGAGAAAIDELREQARASLAGERLTPRVFAEPCAFNVFSHNSAVDAATGVNGEERKLIDESRKIWNDKQLRVMPTCVRVPVERAHSESIVVTLDRAASEDEIRASLEVPGVRVIDNRASNAFPTPLKATGTDDVLVGRIRPDPCSSLDERGRTDRWCLFVCADQLRVGAALNAIRIAELVSGSVRR